ncbi:MAG: NAD(P)/FAD-dependent oxidoreductase [Gemmatimonadota bacterium]|nr:NAD(P)/FAD-dependent oxidoreductase [Gemmatimonadota bacterium]
MSHDVDVIVIGGGPAGSTAARLLAVWGHRALLLTRPAPGPPLAESLTPSCARLLEQIGVLAAVNGAGFVRSTGHTVRWGTADDRVERFAGGTCGWQVSRDAFDRVLLNQAKVGGALVHRHASVRDVTHDGQRHVVQYEERGHTRIARASWVVDASGRTGFTSRQGSARRILGPRTTAIVGLWEQRPSWGLADESHTFVESYRGGWAWSVPLSRIRRQVTVMLDPSRTELASGRRLRQTYREELARTDLMRRITPDARFIGSVWARDATSYECASSAGVRLLAVGDAASFVDPLSSFGVKKALASGWLGAVAVHSALTEPAMEQAAVDFYVARQLAMMTGLRRQFAVLAGEAREAHPAGFWDDRAGRDADADLNEPDIGALRTDTAVRAAFDAIRERECLQLASVPGVEREQRPAVAGNRVVLTEHLIVPGQSLPLRFVRNVDLVVLARLAPSCDDVPQLFDAYVRAAAPVALPDFISALAVLVAKGVLRFA